MSINILQWNSRSIRSNKGDLEQLLHKNQIHIALISETWLKVGSTFSLSGYNVCRMDRDDGYGGVAILIKNDVSYKQLNNITTLPGVECIGVTLILKANFKQNIYVIYKRPQVMITRQEWSLLFDDMQGNYIVGGDFNSHHLSWGSLVSDRGGTALLSAIEDKNLVILNDGSPTRLTAPGTAVSAVDLTLCSPSIASIINFKISTDTLGSDHFAIQITLTPPQNSLKEHTNINTSPRWKLKNANWELYHNHMEFLTSQALDNADLSYETFITNLNKSAELAIPVNKATKNCSSFKRSWWTEECKLAVNNRKDIFNTYKNNPTLENFIKFKKASAIVKRTIKKNKTNSWRAYCSNLNKSTPTKKIWNEIKKLKNSSENKQYPSQGEWTYQFLDILAPPFVQLLPLSEDYNNPNIEEHYLTSEIKIQELEIALKSHNNSSPGLDNIHYSMIYYLPLIAKRALTMIFSNVLENSNPPQSWHDYKIIPILKQNKNPLEPSSYRPISLASCVLKTFERIIKNRLCWWLNHTNRLPKSQYGFRRSFSTNDAILKLTTDIQIAFSNNKIVMALFLDIKGAFDSINLNILTDKLKKEGVPILIIKLISALYNNRKLFLHIANEVIGPQTSSLGLAQGTILSPVMYVLFTKELESLLPPDVKIIQYADDICLYASDKSFNKCKTDLSKALKITSNWMTDNGLQISYDKTNITTFTTSRIQLPAQITLNNKNIQNLHVAKFLGVYMDYKLTWKDHILYIIRKCERYINILRMISSLRWGADPCIALLFYRACIRSIIDYGCLAYGNASDSLLKKLDVISNRCLRLCIGCLNDTPINALLSEAAELPLALRRKKLGISFLLSLYRKSSTLFQLIQNLFTLDLTARHWITKKSPQLVSCFYSIHNKWNDLTETITCNTNELEYNILINPPKCYYLDSLPRNSYNNNEFNHLLKSKFKDKHVFYTDGSSMDGRYGCAWYDSVTGTSKSFKLSNIMSVYTTELIAILECLKYIEETRFAKEYLIISDSKSTIQQLQKISFASSVNPVVIKILQQLHKLESNVRFMWVRGHAELKGNEHVDKLAKQGCNQLVKNCSISTITDLHTLMLKEIKDENTESHQNYGKGMHYLLIQKTPLYKPWFKSFQNQSKFFVKTMCRLRTNHGICPKYMLMIKKAQNNLCTCGEVGDLEHIIMLCNNLQHQRNELFKKISKNILSPFDFRTILMSREEKIYVAIIDFLSTTNINI